MGINNVYKLQLVNIFDWTFRNVVRDIFFSISLQIKLHILPLKFVDSGWLTGYWIDKYYWTAILVTPKAHSVSQSYAIVSAQL